MSIFSRFSSFRKSKNATDRASVPTARNNSWEIQEITEDMPAPQRVKLRLNLEANELVVTPDFRFSCTIRKIGLSSVTGVHTLELRNRKEHKDDFWNELNVPRAMYKQILQQATNSQPPVCVLVVQTTRTCSAKNSLMDSERLYAKLMENAHSYFRPFAHVFLTSAADLEGIRTAITGVLTALDQRVLTQRIGEHEFMTPVSAYCNRFAKTEFDSALRGWLLREHNLLRLCVKYYPQYAVARERSDEVSLLDVYAWLQLVRIGHPRVELDTLLKAIEAQPQLNLDSASTISFANFERLYFDVLLDRFLAELRTILRKLNVDVEAFVTCPMLDTMGSEMNGLTSGVNGTEAGRARGSGTQTESSIADRVSENRALVSGLFARKNSLMDPARAEHVTQNMDEPLTSYWIASSHNTYLTRHQTPGHSTCDAYRHALLMGARCIEMDVYDGDDSPVILHGMGIAALSNKIKLEAALRVVKKYAFVTSEYPVIISIENHCVQQLGKMAGLFREVLGEQLVDRRLSDCDRATLPSPNQLRNRFILKASYRRKHHAQPNENTMPIVNSSSSGNLSSMSTSISTSSICGKLNGSHNLSFSDEDELANREGSVGVGEAVTWGKFQLADKRLPPVPTSNSLATETEWLWVLDSHSHVLYFQKHDVHAHKRRVDSLLNPAESLRGYAWFHSSASREDAEKLLLANRSLGNGTFLVRPCQGGRKTPFALSFLFENTVLHARIEMNLRNETVDGQKVVRPRFGLDGLSARFSALSVPLLIAHYRRNKLELKLFQSTLGDPVSVWLHEELTREAAAALLQHNYLDGLFLIRRSRQPNASETQNSKAKTVWSISMCAAGSVQHVRVWQLDDSSYVIGGGRFESLEQVVRHYVDQPLVGSQPLREAVTYRMIDSMRKSLRLKLEAVETQASVDETTTGSTDYIRSSDSHSDGTLFPYFRATSAVRDAVREILQHKGSSLHPLFAVDLLQCEYEQLSCHSETADCCFLLREQREPGLAKIAKRRRHSDSLFFGPKRLRARAHADAGVKIVCARSDSNHDVCLVEMIRAVQKALAAAEPASTSASAPVTPLKKRDSLKANGAAEFFELIVYCKSLGSSGSFGKTYPADRMFSMQAAYTGWANRLSYDMPEGSLHVGSASNRQVLRFTTTNLMRSYPNWRQVTSGNFNPVTYWNVGTQLVALNYQTVGKPMMVNSGRFADNGGCGYVLKPSYMRQIASIDDEAYFDPSDRQRAARLCNSVTLELTVVAAHHICRQQPGHGLLSVFCEVEVFGACFDCQLHRTRTVPNGFFPVWNDRFRLPVANRDLAMLLITVYDTESLEDSDSENKSERDSKAKRTLIGYACYPVSALREGLRSVALRAPHGNVTASSALLVHLLIRESSPSSHSYS